MDFYWDLEGYVGETLLALLDFDVSLQLIYDYFAARETKADRFTVVSINSLPIFEFEERDEHHLLSLGRNSFTRVNNLCL